MTAPDKREVPVADRWKGASAGRHYSGARFRNARAAGRDPRAVEHLLARHGKPGATRRVLDVACGTGRMTPTLRSHARSYVGLDASRSMLGSTPADELFADRPRPTWIQGSAFELPFTDRAFDLVVCNRLLHHLEEAALPRVLGELLRVSSDLVLVSFWDATTYQGWRRSRGLRRATSDLRIPRPRSRMATAIHAAGGEVLGWRSAGLRLVTLQTFAAMRRR